MDNSGQSQSNLNGGFQLPLPNASGALVLGILSIVLFCCCTGIVGLILGIIGLVFGNKAVKLYTENAGAYTESSYKNANAGKICSIIGIVLSIAVLIYGLINMQTNIEILKAIMDGTFDPSSYYSF